jgi:hypothetical protein
MRAADGCRDRTASLSARRSTNTRPLIDGVAADPPCGMVGSEVCEQVGRLQGGRKCESGEGPRVGRPEKHCLDGIQVKIDDPAGSHLALRMHCSSPDTYDGNKFPSRLEPADRQAAPQVLKDL